MEITSFDNGNSHLKREVQFEKNTIWKQNLIRFYQSQSLNSMNPEKQKILVAETSIKLPDQLGLFKLIETVDGWSIYIKQNTP